MDNENERIVRTLMMRSTPRPLLFFDVEIVAHCNLNCKSCASFSPLAAEEFLDIDDYERDLRQLSQLAEGEMHHINILGGEPLLHPKVTDFFKLTRKYFPVGIIHLVTNGILLTKMDEKFWEACREYQITVAPTRYPITVDYDSLQKMAQKNGVAFRYFGDVPRVGGWVHPTIDLSGWRNEVHSFLHCWQANNCTVLKQGKLYPCPVISNITRFNKKFNTNMTVSKKDYIDIYEVQTLKEVMEFFAKPVPFCRFCNTFQNKVCDWGISKKKIEEWT